MSIEEEAMVTVTLPIDRYNKLIEIEKKFSEFTKENSDVFPIYYYVMYEPLGRAYFFPKNMKQVRNSLEMDITHLARTVASKMGEEFKLTEPGKQTLFEKIKQRIFNNQIQKQK